MSPIATVKIVQEGLVLSIGDIGRFSELVAGIVMTDDRMKRIRICFIEKLRRWFLRASIALAPEYIVLLFNKTKYICAMHSLPTVNPSVLSFWVCFC